MHTSDLVWPPVFLFFTFPLLSVNFRPLSSLCQFTELITAVSKSGTHVHNYYRMSRWHTVSCAGELRQLSQLRSVIYVIFHIYIERERLGTLYCKSGQIFAKLRTQRDSYKTKYHVVVRCWETWREYVILYERRRRRRSKYINSLIEWQQRISLRDICSIKLNIKVSRRFSCDVFTCLLVLQELRVSTWNTLMTSCLWPSTSTRNTKTSSPRDRSVHWVCVCVFLHVSVFLY